MESDEGASTSRELNTLSDDEFASIEALALLSPTQRFDQMVRTARFIAAGRIAMGRRHRG